MTNQAIRILVITPLFYPLAGGSQQYLEDIYANMVKIYPNTSVDVLCYNTEKIKSLEKYRGLNIIRIPCLNILPTQFALPHPIELINFLWKNKNSYDLIHSNTRFFDTSWWGPIYSKLIKKPIIITDHCASSPTHPNFLITLIAQILDHSLVKLTLKLYNQIYTISQTTKQFIKQTYHLNSKIIYGGTERNIFKPSAKINKSLKVIFVGRMIDSKGPQLVFNIANKFPTVNFTFVGPGPLVTSFQKKQTTSKLLNVKILGELNQSKTAKLMSQADILVHPSSHHEGIPTVLKEAGACQIAVVASNVGATKEIIINNTTGLLINQKNELSLSNSLNKLIENPNLRRKLAKNLYQLTISKFNWEESVRTLYQDINRLVKQVRDN